MIRTLFMAIGSVFIFAFLAVNNLSAQWTSAHPGMEWNSIMTGRTTGHIADLWLTNLTDEPMTVTVGPFYIPGPGQPYVTDGPHTISVPDRTTLIFPLDGSCADRDEKPPKAGTHSDPATWIPPSVVSLPPAGGAMPSDEGWEPGDDIENLVTIPKYPGHEVPFTYVIDNFSKRAEQVAPLMLEASRLLNMGYDDLEMGNEIQTPISLDVEKEKQVLVQLGVWQYSAALQGETFLLEEYQGDAEKEYKELTGESVSNLDAEEQNSFRDGIQDIWDASLDLGEEVKTVNRPETWYTYSKPKCVCDSLFLDAEMVVKGREHMISNESLGTWKEKLNFNGAQLIKNDTVVSDLILVDPRNREDLLAVIDKVADEFVILNQDLYDLLDNILEKYKDLDDRIFWLEHDLRVYLKEKWGEEEGEKRMKEGWKDLLFLYDEDASLKMLFRETELTCYCDETNEECELLHGRRTEIGDKVDLRNPGELEIKIVRIKYTRGKGGKLKIAGDIGRTTDWVPNGDYIHDFGQGDEPIKSIEVPLSFKGKGAKQPTAQVIIKVSVKGYCSDEDCGGALNTTKCTKFLFVQFIGISQ